MSRRQPDEAHGCSPSELAILDRLDAGESEEAVCKVLGAAPSWVRKVRQTYSGSWHENNIAEAAIRAGSIRYAAALAATGKVYA